MRMKSEFFLLSRAIVTAGVWIAAGISCDEYIISAAVIITLITGFGSET